MSRKKHRKHNKLQKVAQAPEVAAEPQVESNVTRYKAVIRSPIGEWWFENKKRVRLIAIIAGVGLLVGWLLFELLNLVF